MADGLLSIAYALQSLQQPFRRCEGDILKNFGVVEGDTPYLIMLSCNFRFAALGGLST
jgi:hypothetical protein